MTIHVIPPPGRIGVKLWHLKSKKRVCVAMDDDLNVAANLKQLDGRRYFGFDVDETWCIETRDGTRIRELNEFKKGLFYFLRRMECPCPPPSKVVLTTIKAPSKRIFFRIPMRYDLDIADNLSMLDGLLYFGFPVDSTWCLAYNGTRIREPHHLSENHVYDLKKLSKKLL